MNSGPEPPNLGRSKPAKDGDDLLQLRAGDLLGIEGVLGAATFADEDDLLG